MYLKSTEKLKKKISSSNFHKEYVLLISKKKRVNNVNLLKKKKKLYKLISSRESRDYIQVKFRIPGCFLKGKQTNMY